MAVTNPAITVRTGELVDYIKLGIAANRVPCIWGQPGIGKTAIVEQLAADTARKLYVFVASQHEPTDVVMEMYVDNNGQVKFRKPDFSIDNGPAVLFIDEANRGLVMMQNAMLRIVNERMIGTTPLPANLAIVMACNYETDGGGIGKMTAALAGRAFHLDTVSSLDDWREWAITPAANIAPVVLAYLGFRPDAFHRFNPVERTTPSPRTWHMLSDMYNQGPPLHMLPAIAAGCVGQEEGIGFCAYENLYRKMTAHSVDALLLNPTTYPIPTNVNELYALSAALSARMDANNADNAIAYLERLTPEYNIYAVKLATSKKAELQNTHAFSKWFVKHQGKF